MTIIISKDEYKRRKIIRNKKSYDSEKEKISQRREKILNLLDEGLKRKDRYILLNISLKTYKCDTQFIKEQGLI